MKKILCLGDSITDCDHCFSSDMLGNGYVKILSHKLAEQGKNCQVRNCGTDGFTLFRLLQNSRLYLSDNPDLITILIGINDVGLMMNTDRSSIQKQEMLLQFDSRYRELITILTKSVSHILLMEPFLFSWPAVYKNWFPYVKEMSKQIAKLATDFQLPFLSLQQELNAKAQIYGFSRITTDGIHLTTQGHEVLAQRLYSCITAHNYV